MEEEKKANLVGQIKGGPDGGGLATVLTFSKYFYDYNFVFTFFAQKSKQCNK